MKKVNVLHIDAFSRIPGKGNPAGVVLNGGDYTDKEMQLIAKVVGYNETAFVQTSNVADIRIRYFTPGYETPLCGHATMGTVFALRHVGKFTRNTFNIETGAGVLPIEVAEQDGEIRMTMQQAAPKFISFEGDKQLLAEAIGLEVDELDEAYPIEYGNTGQWTLIVPVKTLESFRKMKPKTDMFPQVLKQMPKTSIHPITFSVRDADSDMHGRHFSSPYAVTIEDPVTGTASGVMGAYFKQFVQPDLPLPITLKIEQGHEIDKDGAVYVHVEEAEKNQLKVSISGTAVFVKQYEVVF